MIDAFAKFVESFNVNHVARLARAFPIFMDQLFHSGHIILEIPWQIKRLKSFLRQYFRVCHKIKKDSSMRGDKVGINWEQCSIKSRWWNAILLNLHRSYPLSREENEQLHFLLIQWSDLHIPLDIIFAKIWKCIPLRHWYTACPTTLAYF
jgi:hypothetical protein